ncbi:lipoate--protein ligase family protein [Pseudanabaena sp. PCC 6802]|uniref:lipoate--protein ligase family protein n=1 Tax=Pseudanabaena sp. PCC 6802 TaxID=118173 RepID=UPI000344CF05|nr:lipoate--protein ligase family protein [Pseudanabaena sp. PCC 6802]
MPTNIWRLLPQIHAPGASQMALDSWLLDRHCQEDLPQSVLRFYHWSPGAISLGYHQREIPDRWHDLAIAYGLDIVRRPSGGRAVLHGGDLTYAVITNVNSKNRRAVYAHISEFLVKGLASLGVRLSYGQPSYNQPERVYIRDRNCFATATSADLVASDGRKLIGSAQLYRHNSVLQHGSIAIAPNYELLEQIFESNTSVVGLAELLDGTANVDESDVENLSDRLISALTDAAAQHFDVEFVDMLPPAKGLAL